MRTPRVSSVALAAFRYSIPVLLGYSAIGMAFGLLLVNAGYPAWLALLMSVVIYAGTAQYMAVGLFASGAGLWECLLVTFVVNARHMAYGVSLLKKLRVSGPFAPYIVFALSDETFALLSGAPDTEDRGLFMFFVSLFDQCYWVLGTVIGALAGSLLPWKLEGFDFALTALFVVLLVEQVLRVRQALPFVLTAVVSVACPLILGPRMGLLAAMGGALAVVAAVEFLFRPRRKGASKLEPKVGGEREDA